MIYFDEPRCRGLSVLVERVRSLKQDGYHVIVESTTETCSIVKLRHHNGNRVLLKLDYQDGFLSQFTNNILRYHQKVCEP